MTIQMVPVVPTEDDEQDALESLLHDPQWVRTEFAAIMNASGFGDRLIVATLSHPVGPRPAGPRPLEFERRAMRRTSGRTSVDSRVRSPPLT